MTVTAADLLPQDAGTFEKATANALTDALPVPLREVLDPALTPAAFLPFLAAHESVDLWFDDWTDDRKRAMIAEAVSLAARKGTRIGAVRFLSYVDATMIDAVAYPSPFIFKYALIGRTPIGLGPFLATYLIRVDTARAPKSMAFSRSFLGQDFIVRPSRDKFERALVALRAAKAPETEVRVDFAFMRQINLTDNVLLDGDGEHALGDYVARTATPRLSAVWSGLARVDFSSDANSGYAALFEDI